MQLAAARGARAAPPVAPLHRRAARCAGARAARRAAPRHPATTAAAADTSSAAAAAPPPPPPSYASPRRPPPVLRRPGGGEPHGWDRAAWARGYASQPLEFAYEVTDVEGVLPPELEARGGLAGMRAGARARVERAWRARGA
jgi:hypothetical protein